MTITGSVTNTPILISLVHGTFARDATWTSSTSLLCVQLREKFPRAEIEAFTWSGRNSILDRAAEAARFRAFIERRSAERPQIPHFVVSHSHGGNVALMALRNTSTRLDGIACLSTPFLQVRRRNVGSLGASYLKLAVTLVVAILFAAVFVPLRGLTEAFKNQTSAQVLAGAFFAVILPSMLFAEWLERKSMDAAERASAACQLPSIQNENLLIISTTRDEANGLLIATQFLDWLVETAWGGIARSGGDVIDNIIAPACRVFARCIHSLSATSIQGAFFVFIVLMVSVDHTGKPSMLWDASHGNLEAQPLMLTLALSLALVGIVGFGVAYQFRLPGRDDIFAVGNLTGFAIHSEPFLTIKSPLAVFFLVVVGLLVVSAVFTAEATQNSVLLAILTKVEYLIVIGVVLVLIAVSYAFWRSFLNDRTLVIWTILGLLSWYAPGDGYGAAYTFFMFVIFVPGSAFVVTAILKLLLQCATAILTIAVAAVLWLPTCIAYGKEAAQAMLYCSLNTNASPEGSWNIHQLGGGSNVQFAHASHSDPKAIRLVIEWIRQSLTTIVESNAGVRRHSMSRDVDPA